MADFLFEYAKSGRAGCKKCQNKIEKDDLRVGHLVPSNFHDGKDTKWYHLDCATHFKFDCEAAGGFPKLHPDDQNRLRSLFPPGSASGSSSSNDEADLNCEYAKSSRSSCRQCHKTIVPGHLRIFYKDRDPEQMNERSKHLKIPFHHHVDCWFQTIEFNEEQLTSLPNFASLMPQDQRFLIRAARCGGPAECSFLESLSVLTDY